MSRRCVTASLAAPPYARLAPQQRLVERARAIAREIQRHVEIARRAHLLDHPLAQLVVQQAGELPGIDLDARNPLLAAPAHLPHAPPPPPPPPPPAPPPRPH